MMRKPEVGEFLYALNVGNAARGREQKLTRVEVSRVGRKYFYVVNGYSEQRFLISDWSQDVGGYSRDVVLYENPQQWEDDKEAAFIRGRIIDAAGLGGIVRRLPLSSLRAINQILDQAEDAGADFE